MCLFVFADDISIEEKIYEKIFKAITHQENTRIYVDGDIPSLDLKSKVFTLTDSCKKADIVVMTQSELPYECHHKIVFGTRYRHLRKAYVIGAFFWQKGRPNIVFDKNKLKQHYIELDPSLSEYIE